MVTTVKRNKKAVAVNPLKLSSPLGASLAFLGLKGMMPLFHGSQGCTAFAKVILVRHFREAIPMSTTAMTEVSTILGGGENIEAAILTLVEKSNPDVIGLLTTGLTETRGEDFVGIMKNFRKDHPELDNLPIIFVSTPDYKGALQQGYAAAVEQIVATDYPAFSPVSVKSRQVTILAGSLLSPGDVQEIKEIVTAFGLTATILPDLSGSLDGHLDEDYNTVTSGGTTVDELRTLSESAFTLAIGESMRGAAQVLQQKFGTDYEVFPRLAGLQAVDRFIMRLAEIAHKPTDVHLSWCAFPRSGNPTGVAPLVQPVQVPDKFTRQRRQLQDGILDTHFYFSRKRVCLALEPDLLYQTSWLLQEMGAEIQAAVTTTKSPLLEHLPIDSVTIGDLEDLEDLAAGADLIITNSHGKSICQRLQIPLYRMGYPVFDRLGNGQKCLIGYRGSLQFLFDLGNLFMEEEESKINH
jgi:nitrogenase molybdenum-iron protein NifN